MTVVAIPNRPSGSDPRSIAAIMGDFDAILTGINSKQLDFVDNLGPSVQSDYQHVAFCSLSLNNGDTAGTRLLPWNYPASGGSSLTSLVNIPGAYWQLFAGRLDPADYALTGRTAKYRLKVRLNTNATAPATNLTFGLYPVTIKNGAAAQPNYVLSMGSVVAQIGAINAPAANSQVVSNSGDFAAPVAGDYAFGVVLSATPATNSITDIRLELQRRTV